MKPSEAVKLLKIHIQANIATFLWGKPGIGKSSVVAQLAKELGIGLIDIRLSQMEPVDLLGLPTIIDQKTHWSTPAIYPTEGAGILFLDEANAAPREVLAAAYQLVLDRQLGTYHVPENWVIVLAGNRTEDHAIVTTMPAPLNNRMAHIDFDMEFEDWSTWAIKNDVRTEIVSFLRFKQDMLHDFNADKKAWPSPRSWCMVDESLKHATRDMEYEVVRSLVGEGAAAEFMTFTKLYRDLPSIQDIVKKPKATKIPKDPAGKFAISGMIGANMNHKNIAPVMDYLQRLPTEFVIPTLRQASLKDDTIVDEPLVSKWITANNSVFICD